MSVCPRRATGAGVPIIVQVPHVATDAGDCATRPSSTCRLIIKVGGAATGYFHTFGLQPRADTSLFCQETSKDGSVGRRILTCRAD